VADSTGSLVPKGTTNPTIETLILLSMRVRMRVAIEALSVKLLSTVNLPGKGRKCSMIDHGSSCPVQDLWIS
jgi:hypothetical protein